MVPLLPQKDLDLTQLFSLGPGAFVMSIPVGIPVTTLWFSDWMFLEALKPSPA